MNESANRFMQLGRPSRGSDRRKAFGSAPTKTFDFDLNFFRLTRRP